MLSLLRLLQQRAPISFAITAVNVDQKQPNFSEHVLPEYLTREQVPHRIVEQETYPLIPCDLWLARKSAAPQGRGNAGPVGQGEPRPHSGHCAFAWHPSGLAAAFS